MRDRHLTDEEDKALRDGNRELLTLAAKRETAASAAEHADNMYRIYAENLEVLLFLADTAAETARRMMPPFPVDYGKTPLGRRMTRDSELYLGTARGMPTSDARKRLEDLTCHVCGHTGEGVVYYYHRRTVMCGAPMAVACLERAEAALACLEPVTQA